MTAMEIYMKILGNLRFSKLINWIPACKKIQSLSSVQRLGMKKISTGSYIHAISIAAINLFSVEQVID